MSVSRRSFGLIALSKKVSSSLHILALNVIQSISLLVFVALLSWFMSSKPRFLQVDLVISLLHTLYYVMSIEVIGAEAMNLQEGSKIFVHF